MGVDGIGEVGDDRASEGQAAGVYGAGFTVGPLAGKGARGGMRETRNKVSFDKEFMEEVEQDFRNKEEKKLKNELCKSCYICICACKNNSCIYHFMYNESLAFICRS